MSSEVSLQKLKSFCTIVHTDESPQQVAMLVAKEDGFRRIGHGAFSAVYGKPGCDYVYKIGRTVANGAYLSYVRMIKKSKQQYDLFPQIHSVTVYTNGNFNTSYFVVRMERLDRVKWYQQRVSCDVDQFRSGFFCASRSWDWHQPVDKEVLKSENYKYFKMLHRLQMWALRHFDNSASFDLHSGNFMVRRQQGKQIMVLTDPLA